MENASKALLIAGAILIAIVLISVSILLITKSKSVSDKGVKATNTISNAVDTQVSGWSLDTL